MRLPGNETPGASDNIRHLLLLDEFERSRNVSQRTLARRMGLAASLVNRLVRELLDGGHVEVVDRNVQPYAYRLTDDGHAYRKRLTHGHFRSVLDSYRDLQVRIRKRLTGIRGMGVRRLALYGAGEVMEVTLPLAVALGLDVVGVVDDDPEKQGEERGGHVVHAPGMLAGMKPDGVLITTFRHKEEIQRRLGGGPVEHVPLLEL